ncbi:MAG: glycoside hydrolase family 25 protein [Clostridia bacterium]|nr:glycoside hydrolase family 25 protein [Clostridia bacterium]
MKNFYGKITESLQNNSIYKVIVISLLLIFLIIGVYFSLFSSGSPLYKEPAMEAIDGYESDTLIINDMYRGQTDIPKFDIELNTYQTELFEVKNNQVYYPGAKIGIDVSSHQGEIDWEKVKETGIDFVIIRTGYRGYSRGRINHDDFFKANIKGATEAGLDVGVYFFSQALTTAEAEEEAAQVLESIRGYDISYPIFFDWETVEAENARTNEAEGELITECAAAFCKKISKAGFTAGVYFNKSQAYDFYDLEKLSAYEFWLAEYQLVPSLYYNFDMWQYTCEGGLSGINTDVDVNISFKDYSN